MAGKPTYKELSKRVRVLEAEVKDLRNTESADDMLDVDVQTLADTFPGGCIISTPDGELLYVNRTMLTISGYASREDFLGTGVAEFWYDPKDRKKFFNRLEKGKARSMEFRFRRKDGSIAWGALSAVRQNIEGNTRILTFVSDITEQKEMQHSLEENQEVIRQLIESTSLGIAIFQNGRIVFANKVVQDILGYTQKEIQAFGKQDVESLMHPDDVPRALKRISDQEKSKTLLPFQEYRFKRKDGVYIWIELHFTPFMYRDERAVGVLLRDITRRKDLEQEILLSGENFTSLAENTYFGLFIMGDEGVVYSNPKALDILGYTPEEVKAESLPGLATSFHPDDMDRFRQRHKDGLTGKKLEPVQEYRLYKKDGQMIWVETAATALNFDRKPAWMVMYRDISERKNLEQTLRESEEKYRKLIEDSADGIALVENAEFTYANLSLARMLGFERGEELVGLPLTDLLAPEFKDLMIERGKKREGGENVPDRYDFLAQRKDGGTFWANLTASLITYKGRRVLQGIVRDISKEKQAEEQLKSHQATLEGLVEKRTEELGESNIALKILLQRQTDDTTEFERKVLFNIKELVQPYVGKLKQSRLNKSQKTWVGILETNLGNIVSPLVHGISLDYLKFTPTEVQVANFVKQGKTTTQIAEVMNLSEKTIGYHRDNIRKKVGIRNKRINLRTFLLSMK